MISYRTPEEMTHKFAATKIASANAGLLHRIFDHLGTYAPGQHCGGFIGFNNPKVARLAGDSLARSKTTG